MDAYLGVVADVLTEGQHKPNRTAVDTVASFGQYYEADLAEGYPLLTTKKMDGFRWNSMIHELLWYFSGEEHVRELSEKTGIWDAWADEDGHLDTAYGRFWRRFPIPEEGLPGETWADADHEWVNEEERTFDQLRYVIDQLEENPRSRRIVVNAWHPANAAVSTLPPCHYTYVFNVQGDRLNLHVTQRSADLALGVPFNIAAYALLLEIIADRTGFEAGTFGHTLVDAHVYCGEGDRGAFYGERLGDLQERLAAVEDPSEYREVKAWLETEAPPEPEAGYDHVPGLLEQLAREPLERPTIEVASKPIDDLAFEDIQLRGYDSHPGIDFEVAE